MKVLGLDIGSASIGWAVIEINDLLNSDIDILGMGIRVIQYNGTEASGFSEGTGKTKCSERTRSRQMRRQLDRWQLHREQLKELLFKYGFMQPEGKFEALSPLEVWKLRADAANPDCKLSLEEIARVLLHINHRRGYKHSKKDLSDSKETKHVAKINSRYKTIREKEQTVGQYFYQLLKESEVISSKGKKHVTYRVKEEVFPRIAYEEEVEKILNVQAVHYPNVLTDKVKDNLFNVIFYQRPLKSCKHLVSLCEFEKRSYKNVNGVEVFNGPRVSPNSSPLAQVCRIYEAINNIKLTNYRREKSKSIIQPSLFEDNEMISDLRKYSQEFIINDKEREEIFKFMNSHEKIKFSDLLKKLKLSESDGFKGDELITNGINGNSTYVKIAKALKNLPKAKQEKLLRFNLEFESKKDDVLVNVETREVLEVVSEEYLHEPLYKLWHTLYSIDDREELFECLRKKFGIEDQETLDNLFAIDFVKDGYANKSAKFMRKILPHLMKGRKYSEACEAIGVNHSRSITTEENDARELVGHIPQLKSGELRQPIVERVLNQTISLANAIKDRYGDIDEVRIELARELKQSKEERKKSSAALKDRKRKNEDIEKEIVKYGFAPTRRRIRKMRLLEESGNKCFYCGTPITPTQVLSGDGMEREHIIPISRYFDDSYANNVCSCRKCNNDKGNKTAYEYMSGKSESEFNSYKERVIDLFNSKTISKRKRDYLMMDGDEIPQDFINRNLNETQYISRKAMELLKKGFRNVYASSGAVTDFFRHAWGYDNILHDLNLTRYKDAGLTEEIENERNGQRSDRIKDWTKRLDHRHHAVDALTIALTRQGYIQRLNTLNTLYISNSQNIKYQAEKRNLEKWAAEQPHISVDEAKRRVDEISVSFKCGKKLTTPGRRYKDKNGVEHRTLVPRGSLHNDNVYGKILLPDGAKNLEYALKNPSLICNVQIREKIEELLSKHEGNVKAIEAYLEGNPIIIRGKNIEMVNCFKEEIVANYPISSIKRKDLDDDRIIDSHIKKVIEARFDEVGNDKEFERSLAERPIYSDPDCTNVIRTVRRKPKVPRSLVITQKDNDNNAIGFSRTDNNHHLALYCKADGEIEAKTASFWNCVKRKRYGLPIIIEDPQEAWDKLAEYEENDDIQELAASFPADDSQFIMSLQINEMFILGMSDDEWQDAVRNKDFRTLNKHLYRVWELSQKQLRFKSHINTNKDYSTVDSKTKQQYVKDPDNSFMKLNPRKVRVDLLGNIILPEL